MFPFDEIQEAVSKAAQAIGEVTGLSTSANRPTFNVGAWSVRKDAYAIVKPLVEHRPEKIEALGASFKDPATMVPALESLASSVRAAMRGALKNGLPPPYDPGDGVGPYSGEQQIAEELQWLGMMLAYAAVTGKATWKQPRVTDRGQSVPLVWTVCEGAHCDTDTANHPKEAKWAVAVYQATKPWILEQFKKAMTDAPPPPPPPPPPPTASPKRFQLHARLAKTGLVRSPDARHWLRLPPHGTVRVRPRAGAPRAGVRGTDADRALALLVSTAILGPSALFPLVLAAIVKPRERV